MCQTPLLVGSTEPHSGNKERIDEMNTKLVRNRPASFRQEQTKAVEDEFRTLVTATDTKTEKHVSLHTRR